MMRMNASVIGVSMKDDLINDYPLVGMLPMRSRYMLIHWIYMHLDCDPDEHNACMFGDQ